MTRINRSVTSTLPRNIEVKQAPTKPPAAAVGGAKTATVRNADAFVRAATTPGTPDPNQPDQYLNPMYGRTDFAQGATNSCGTTSLAICLERMGLHVPRAEIDGHIREFDIGTSMDDIVQYAQGKGLQAGAYDNGNFNTLKTELANGRQIMVLTDVDSAPDGKLNRGSDNDPYWHYMVVTQAFEKDGKQYVTYQNPWGVQQTVPYERFNQLWSDLHMYGMETGYDHAYILLDKAGAKPLPGTESAFNMAASNDLMHGLTNLANGAGDIGKGRVAAGAARIVAGLFGAVTGIAANVFAVPGRFIADAGSSLRKTGADLMNSSNIFSKIGGAVVSGAGWLATGVGKATEAVGNAIGTVGNTISHGIEAAGDWVSNAASSVGSFFKNLF